jgi:hypothetical protein
MTAILLSVAILGQPSNEPRFALYSIGQTVVPGIVEKIDASGSITIAGQPAVAGAEIVALRRLNGMIPALPREPHLLLANGDCIVGKPTGIEGSFLIFRAEGNRTEGERLRFPLTSSAILWLRSPDTVDRERLLPLLTGERADDQVVFRNGDVLSGVLTGVDARKSELEIDVGGAKRTSSIDKVAAVAFGTKLARPRKPSGSYWHLVLANGTRLTLIAATIEKGQLQGQTLYKDSVQIALADIAALDVYQGKALYLSDLKPVRYEYRSFLGERFEWLADRSLDGAELELQSAAGITTFDKGLSTHGECNLVYALDGKYQRLEGQVGLDPRSGKRGSAIVRIQIDGRDLRLNDGRPITLANGILPLRVDVSKGKELKLIVEWGEGGHVGDCVNWGDARLIP